MSEQWVYPNATLVRVTDGDTFAARLARSADFGFHIVEITVSVQRFRLNRAAAAPKSTPSGAGAAARLAELLSGLFTLTSVGPYKYGDEWMAEVALSDGRNLTDVLVTEQWAAPWNGRGAQPSPPWPRTV